MVVTRIADRHGQHLEILPLFVLHIESADWTSVDRAAWERWFLSQDEDVEGVAVTGKRARDVSIVGGIVDGGIEDAVEAEGLCFFVIFVLVAAASGNLNEG